MPKKYVLKNKPWDESKLTRLLKNIQDNATSDRAEAEILLASTKAALQDVIANGSLNDDSPESFISSVDAIHKAVTACIAALNQLGVANERLLKLAQTLQKYKFKEMDLEAKGSGGKKSLFDDLSSFVDDDDA